MEFIDALPEIRSIASNFSYNYPKYETDELINEAWIKGWKKRNNPATEISLIKTQVKRDILDFIRLDQKTRFKHKTIFRTNMVAKRDLDEEEGKESCFFADLHTPTRYGINGEKWVNEDVESIDNKEFLEHSLSGVTKKCKENCHKYFLDNLTNEQMRDKYKVKRNTIEIYRSKTLRECKKSVKERGLVLT